jgi:hypothetical protein
VYARVCGRKRILAKCGELRYAGQDKPSPILKRKSLFHALYGVYTVTQSELQLVLQNSAAKGPMGTTKHTPNGGNNPE